MKYIFTLSAAIILISVAYGQQKTISAPEYDYSGNSSDTSLAKIIHLTDLTTVNKGTHWRFWLTRYIASAFVIDIGSKDSLHCKATITLYTYGKHDDKSAWSVKNIYYKKIKLNGTDAARFFKLANKLHINTYTNREESETSIKVYQMMDATPYVVEFADPKNYIFRACARPADMKEIKQLTSAIDTAINFKQLNDAFEKSIPFEYYSSDKWQGIHKTLK